MSINGLDFLCSAMKIINCKNLEELFLWENRITNEGLLILSKTLTDINC